MLSKKQEREQEEQENREIQATFQKVKAVVFELCSKIGEIDQDLLKFIVRDASNIPSLSDVTSAYLCNPQNMESVYNVAELYNIFEFRSKAVPQNVWENPSICNIIRYLVVPEVLSEVRASLLDTTSVSEISTSTLDTTMGTNNSVLHGSSDYCEL